MELGFGVPDVMRVYADREKNGVRFREAPRDLHGKKLAMFLDSDGAVCSLSSG